MQIFIFNRVFFCFFVFFFIFLFNSLKASTFLDQIIQDDFKSTGMCHYSKAKETFWSFSTVVALQKNSPYTDSISRGLGHKQYIVIFNILMFF